ncbi:MAG: hypothetical protein M1167_01635 [Chloroflexi bacterium]|nr:hypothetical protein [Chloroflexota bacterium]
MSQINPDVMRHLSYAKSIYFHALQHSESESALDRAIAIVNFDGAIEMFLYAVMEHSGSEVANNADFYFLINSVKEKLIALGEKPSLLQEVSIKNMHRARNHIQHHGIIPSIEDAERYKAITYKVMSNLTECLLKKKFEEISLAELIQDSLIKQIFEKAEKAYFSSDYVTSLIYTAAAFERAKTTEQGKLWGSGILLAVLEKALKKKYEDGSDKLFEVIITELEILKLRLDYKKYQKYREVYQFALVPFTTLQHNTEYDLIREIRNLVSQVILRWQAMDSSELKNTATYCLAFALDSILAWQAIPRAGWRS